MLLKNHQITIDPSDPFANDALNRQPSAEALTNFILSSEEAMVLCLDAPWGQGKTTFLRIWQQYLKNQQISTVYFNSWQNDFSDDPLVCLMGEIGAALDDLNPNKDLLIDTNFNKAKNAATQLFKDALPALIKLATYGLVDADKMTETALGKLTEDIASKQIANYEQSKQSLKDFREALEEFAASLNNKKNKKPLVIIIDELDRCRPTFAIEVLEKTKHFFNVKNVVFVMGVDKQQLGSSFKAVYGEGLDVKGYLRRFFDFDYMLPAPDKGLFIQALFTKFGFTEYLKQNHNIGIYNPRSYLDIFSDLSDIYQLSLREQEHCCSQFSIALRIIRDNEQIDFALLGFLIVLKIKYPTDYKNFTKDGRNTIELIKQIENSFGGKRFLRVMHQEPLENYILSARARSIGIKRTCKEYEDYMNSNIRDKDDPSRRGSVLSNLEGKTQMNFSILENAIKKIEIASGFKV